MKIGKVVEVAEAVSRWRHRSRAKADCALYGCDTLLMYEGVALKSYECVYCGTKYVHVLDQLERPIPTSATGGIPIRRRDREMEMNDKPRWRDLNLCSRCCMYHEGSCVRSVSQ